MKKIIAILTLSLAFASNMNAQESKDSGAGQLQSKKDAYELQQYLGLNENLVSSFYTLFEMKREVLENINSSQERKAEMVKIVGLKIQASLDNVQLEKLMTNKELYRKVTGETELAASKK